MIYQLFLHSVKLVLFSPDQHTDLVLFMAPLSPKMADGILQAYPIEKWTEHVHAVAYHLEWMRAAPSTTQAEQTILEATKDLEEREGLDDDTFEPRDIPKYQARTQHLIDCALSQADVHLQSKLKARHWLSLRIKFEACWRGYVDTETGTSKERSANHLKSGITLLNAINILAIYFGELEYVWYWGERSNLVNQWPIAITLVKTCRLGIVGKDADVWKARGWVVYKKVKDLTKRQIDKQYEYTDFMVAVIIRNLT
jgi:chaperonin cofactor prefoldin